jgi:hypothetical protein
MYSNATLNMVEQEEYKVDPAVRYPTVFAKGSYM